jgi:tetratricopeptide (TPR) repeat protein
MKNKQKKLRSSFSPPVVSSYEANQSLSTGDYKKALEQYKVLYKQAPLNEYREALRACYLARANELNNKGMPREAIVLWENHSQYCDACTHVSLYIRSLLTLGSYTKAVHIYDKHKSAIPENDVTAIEEVFAAILLCGDNALKEAVNKDSLLRSHLVFAQQAVDAYGRGQLVDAEQALNSISFRSPYKHFRQLLKGCMHLSRDPVTARITLERIPPSSPFNRLAFIAKSMLLPPLEFAKLLPSLGQAEFQFLGFLKGWDDHRVKLIDKLRRLSDKPKQNPQVLFDLMINNFVHINRKTAKRLSYSLLPHYKAGVKGHEKAFGPLSPEEKAHLSALESIHYHPHRFPPEVWAEYERKLSQSPSHNQPQTLLKRAFALRHAVHFLTKSNGSGSACLLAEKSIDCLEKSLTLDPLDKATYIELTNHYNKTKHNKKYHYWIHEAIKVFPEDKDILLLAIVAARRETDIEAGMKHVNVLIALDPINVLALKHLAEMQIIKAQQLILQKKWDEATNILDAVNYTTSDQMAVTVYLNQGLLEYKKSNIAQAKHLIQQGCQKANSNLIARLQLIVNANRLNVPVAALEKDLGLESTNKLKMKDNNEVRLITHIIDAHDYENNRDLIAAMKAIEMPLKNSKEIRLSESELEKFCEFLLKAKQFQLVTHFIRCHKHLKSPLLTYYHIYAKARGIPAKLKEKDLYLLEEALEKAANNKDARTVMLIDKLLTDAGEDLFDDDSQDELIRQFDEEFGPGARSLIERILEDASDMSLPKSKSKQKFVPDFTDEEVF